MIKFTCIKHRWESQDTSCPVCLKEKQTPQENWEIKTHYTCRHSDKYDYACGKCIKKLLLQAEQKGRKIERKEWIDKVKEFYEKHQ